MTSASGVTYGLSGYILKIQIKIESECVLLSFALLHNKHTSTVMFHEQNVIASFKSVGRV